MANLKIHLQQINGNGCRNNFIYPYFPNFNLTGLIKEELNKQQHAHTVNWIHCNYPQLCMMALPSFFSVWPLDRLKLEHHSHTTSSIYVTSSSCPSVRPKIRDRRTRSRDTAGGHCQMNPLQYCMMILLCVCSFGFSVSSQNCSIEIWAYRSQELCQTLQGPTAQSILVADKTCRRAESGDGTTDPSLLPGSYKAQCTADGKSLLFLESGCVFDDCSSSTVGADVCQRNDTSLASLYSRTGSKPFPVLKLSDLTTIQLSCSFVSDGDTLAVTFVLIGDCSNPDCPRMETQAPSLPPIAITDMPSPSEPTTIAPSTTPGTSEPTTPIRTESVSVVMLLAEIDEVMSDDVALVWQDVTAKHIKVSALRENYDIGNVYMKNITQELLNEQKEIIITDTIATLPPRNSSGTVFDNNLWRQRWRRLEDQSDGVDATRSIRIYFDLYITMPEQSPSNVTAARTFSEAFNTETERVSYLINLARTNLTIFESVKKLSILRDGSINNGDSNIFSPTQPPGNTSNLPISKSIDDTGGNQISIGALAGGAVGSVLLFFVVGLFLYKRGKKDAMSKIGDNDGENPTDLSPSSTNQSSQIHHFNPQAQQHQRWTNEIIVDPSNDDVSTLGGSTLAELVMTTNMHTGMSAQNGGMIAEDEHTASVNVDYDFARQRYRRGGGEDHTIDGDQRTRSIVSEPTQYTAYSKLGSLGAAEDIFADDDRSFERQYAGTDDEDEDDDNVDDPLDEHVDVQVNGTITHNSSGSTGNILHPKKNRSNKTINITPNSSMMPITTTSQSSNISFEVRVPPGMLGMVVDTPGGSIPVVRAVKPTSVLFNQIVVGDLLLQVDEVNVTRMPAVQVSSLISTRSHLHRTLVFSRPSVTNSSVSKSSSHPIPSSPSSSSSLKMRKFVIKGESAP